MNNSNVLFGGPDKPKNILRDALLKKINAVPSLGKICWVCYYFNEPKLFEALISASRRGVSVELVIDANPRSPEINSACISLFQNQPNVKLVLAKSKPLWEYFTINWHAHLHSKLYYFSHPTPHILAGSYNPTTDTSDISEHLIHKIGDHSTSHNVLVTLEDKHLLTKLLTYINQIQSDHARRWVRFSRLNNRSIDHSSWSINFLPRFTSHPVSSLLASKDNNAKILCAISHLKGPNIIQPLIKASQSGKQIELILDATQRRVAPKLLTQCEKYHIKYTQLKANDDALMHNKFIIYKSDTVDCVLFGSFNWSQRSWWLNHEVIITSFDPHIVSSFETRWQQMLALN